MKIKEKSGFRVILIKEFHVDGQPVKRLYYPYTLNAPPSQHMNIVDGPLVFFVGSVFHYNEQTFLFPIYHIYESIVDAMNERTSLLSKGWKELPMTHVLPNPIKFDYWNGVK